MNVTELARILKISPQELRDILPQVGFHIGQKAIKIDNRTAQKIIKEWPNLIKQLARQKKEEEAKGILEQEEKEEEKKTVAVPNFITVRDFAALAQIPVNKVLTELMKNGIFISMNEKIDFETATIIGSDLDLEIKLDERQIGEEKMEEPKLEKILAKEDKDKLQVRPPVVVVMGHVDHGKTKLLDAIRKTDVVAEEAGGITQHIGAYQVTRKDRLITFIDTPGHEAFTAMRNRGAKIADIAILVVAADDGVKPQTIEAFRIIEATGMPFIVVINKIDKKEADVNKTKQELASQLNITPEDWGGKVVCALVSATVGTGIEDLLDIILLTADMEADNIRANPKAQAVGTVIESHIDKGAGLVATILIQNGTLRIGDQLCFGGKIYGKVRALQNDKGENLDKVESSAPARIIGLKILPEVGDMLEVGEGEKVKGKSASWRIKARIRQVVSEEQPEEKEKGEKVKKINLIIKTDVLGSAEAIEESLEKINTEEVKIKIVNKGLGNIAQGDIKRAEDTQAQIVGFNVKISPSVEDLIREKNIKVNVFNIIYDLIQYVKDEMQALVEPKTERVGLGELKVLVIFRTEANSQIIGGKVLTGKIKPESLIEVIREKEIIGRGKLIRLQSGKQDVNLAEADQECGLQYEGKPIIKEGDILRIYTEEKITEKI